MALTRNRALRHAEGHLVNDKHHRVRCVHRAKEAAKQVDRALDDILEGDANARERFQRAVTRLHESVRDMDAADAIVAWRESDIRELRAMGGPQRMVA